jgi:hypothetical protein
MPLVGFELTSPVFERAETVHALDRAATVIGLSNDWITVINELERMWKKTVVD